MKKVFLSKRNALISPAGISVGSVVLAFAILILLMRFIFPETLVQIAAPLVQLGSSITEQVSGVTVLWRDRVKLEEERDLFAKQTAALSVENQALKARIEDITKLIGKGPAPLTGVLGGVLLRPPYSGYDILVLNVGAQDGVFEGMRAFASGGTPIGIVESSTEHTARVVLFSASGSTHPVWIGKERTPATLTGYGAGSFGAIVPKATNPEVGDLVYITGPGALPIGMVQGVVIDPTSASAELSISALVNAYSLTWVELQP
jgi:cell shape-determining protein MreC